MEAIPLSYDKDEIDENNKLNLLSVDRGVVQVAPLPHSKKVVGSVPETFLVYSPNLTNPFFRIVVRGAQPHSSLP